MNQFLGSLMLLPAEQMLNHLLARDPYLAARLKPFTGKAITLLSERPSARITLLLLEGRVRLSSLDSDMLNQTPDACIRGNASDLSGLLLDSASRPLANSAIEVTGDALLVQDLFTTLRELDLDWQDYLAPLLGEVVTHELGQFSARAQHWGKEARRNLGQSMDAYLKEERQLVPDRTSLDGFSTQLDQLRLRLDRVAARAELLQSRIDKSLKNQHLSD